MKYLVTIIAALGLASSSYLHSDTAEAYNGCAAGWSKFADRADSNPAYPAKCRLNVCRRVGSAGMISTFEPFPSLAIQTTFFYAKDRAAPSNACPSSVNNSWGG